MLRKQHVVLYLGTGGRRETARHVESCRTRSGQIRQTLARIPTVSIEVAAQWGKLVVVLVVLAEVGPMFAMLGLCSTSPWLSIRPNSVRIGADLDQHMDCAASG